MSANSEEQSQVFPYTFTGHLCPLQSDICPEKTLCLAAASCSTNTPHCPTVAQLLFFQEKHVYECSSEAALTFGRVTARLKTSGELQHERALAIIHTWDTTSRAQRVDVSCGAANLILRALASLNSTYASPVPQVPVRFGTSVACCPAGELLDGLHVPAFVAELDEGATSASCGFIYTGGEFRIWTDPNFSARYFDAEEANVYHIQAGVLPCYLFGCIVHRTYQEQFFDRLAVHMLKDNPEEETMSTVAQTLGRDQVVTQNLLRIRYVVRNSGQYACLALNVLPIDCPGAMNGESPAATPSALSSVMPPAEFPDPVTQFCVQRAASRLGGGGGGGIGEAERLHGCTAEMEEGLLPDGLQFSAIVEPVPVKGVKVPVSCVLVTVDKHMNSELSAKPAGIYDQYANTCTSTGSTCGNRSRRNAASLRGSTSVHDFLNESTLFRGQTGAHVSDAAEIIHYDVSGLISRAPRNDKQACDLDRHEWKLRTSCNNPYQAEDQLLPRLVSDCRKSWKLKCLKKRKRDIGIEQQRSDTKSKSRQKLGNNPSQQDEVHQRKEEEHERMQRHYELQYQHLPSKNSGDETKETQDSRKPEQAKYQRGHTKSQLSIAGLQKGESSKVLSSANCTTFSSPALSTYWQKGSPSAQYRHALYPVVLDQAEIDFGAMRLPLSPSSGTMRAHAEESHLSQRYERLNLKILDDNDINLGSCSDGNDGPSTHNECEASQTYIIPSCQTFSTTLTPPKAM